MKPAALLVLMALPLAAQRKPGSQLDHLPSTMEILTHFGERADISPDSKRIAFMTKSFGDAMVIDLDTRVIRCLTCNVPAAAFLRVMHLSNGDYILIGPERFQDIRTSRTRDNELWLLSKEQGAKPVRLDQKMSEGAAISKKSFKIAYSQTHEQAPELADGADDRRRCGCRGAQAREQEDGLREQGSKLRDRAAGFLRQRQQDDVHVLRAAGPRVDNGDRPEDRPSDELLEGSWNV